MAVPRAAAAYGRELKKLVPALPYGSRWFEVDPKCIFFTLNYGKIESSSLDGRILY